VDLYRGGSFRNKILQIFPQGFFLKMQIFGESLQQLAISGLDVSEIIYKSRKLTTNWPAYGMLTFHFYSARNAMLALQALY